jgi:hypothetical protein
MMSDIENLMPRILLSEFNSCVQDLATVREQAAGLQGQCNLARQKVSDAETRLSRFYDAFEKELIQNALTEEQRKWVRRIGNFSIAEAPEKRPSIVAAMRIKIGLWILGRR